MLWNSDLVSKLFAAAVTRDWPIAGMDFLVLVKVASVRKWFATVADEGFVAKMAICMISVLIFARKSLLANFTFEAVLVGVLFHFVAHLVSLEIVAPLEWGVTHIALERFWDDVHVAAHVFVQIARWYEGKVTAFKGALEWTISGMSSRRKAFVSKAVFIFQDFPLMSLGLSWNPMQSIAVFNFESKLA